MSRRLALAASLLVVALVPASGAAAATGTAKATAFPVTSPPRTGSSRSRSDHPDRLALANGDESLFALGAGPQVIAVDDQSDYPKSAPKTALSGFTPNVEAIATYRPDLVIVTFDPKELVASLTKLGIPVLYHKAVSTFPGAYQQIRQLGRATGRGAQAAALVERMKRQIGQVVAKRKRPRQARRFTTARPTFFSATSTTFVGRVYGLFGLKNIADAAPGGSSTRSSRPSSSSRPTQTWWSSPTRSAAARRWRRSRPGRAGRR